MARLVVFSDNLAARVEVFYEGDSIVAICSGCNRGRTLVESTDLLDGERARFGLEDALEEVVTRHADRCILCADPECLIETRHQRGHRCRKN